MKLKIKTGKNSVLFLCVFSFLSIFLSGSLIASAQVSVSTDPAPAPVSATVNTVISAYRSYKDVGSFSINVPTVVEVPFADEFIERLDFAVLDTTTNSFEPYFFKQETFTNQVPVTVTTDISPNTANAMNDGNSRTYADFLLPENAIGHVQITISSASPITSSSLTTLLDNNVALPTAVQILATVDGADRIVVANRKMDGHTIRFLQTTSNKWIINFSFGQPLRIGEIRLNQDNAESSSVRSVRFLAQPARSYRIYFDPDRSAFAPTKEAGNLASARDVLAVSAPSSLSSKNNPNYIIADTDNDGLPDIRDNCVSVANSDQKDVDTNYRGDVCDDFDQDGLTNIRDNCPDQPNRDQRDEDSDGIGDVCDGQESRITERYTWLPWVGIGLAALVLIILFGLTAKSIRRTSIRGTGTDTEDTVG